jgi:hypothetical protein
MQKIAEMGKVVGTVQTDTFCEGCGYNLHAQPVVRDDRLGVLICGCPECGKYSAAGQTTTAARLWLNRIATTLLVSWVFFLLVVFALGALFLGMLAYGQVAELTATENIQKTVKQLPGYAGPGYAAGGNVTYYESYYVIRPLTTDAEEAQRRLSAQILIHATSLTLALLGGVFFAVFVWHAPWRLRPLALLPVLVGCGFAAAIWYMDPMSSRVRTWGLGHIARTALLDAIALAIGVLIGRTFARAMLTLLVPPKARQHLAFLWTCDGKKLRLPT